MDHSMFIYLGFLKYQVVKMNPEITKSTFQETNKSLNSFIFCLDFQFFNYEFSFGILFTERSESDLLKFSFSIQEYWEN